MRLTLEAFIRNPQESPRIHLTMWLEHGVNLRIRLVPGDGAWCPWAVVKLGIRLVPRKVVRVMVDPRVNTWRLGSTSWSLG